MIDLFLYYIRKFEESKIGKKVSPVHQEIFPLVEKLAVNLDGFEKGKEIRDWVGSRIQK